MKFQYHANLGDTKMIEMIAVAMQEEVDDIAILDTISKNAISQTDYEIIRQIRLDEQKHYRIFESIYEKLVFTDEKKTTPKPRKKAFSSLQKIYEKAMFDELEAINFYRKIYFAFSEITIRDMLYEIITDEQNHAVLLQYLYFKIRI